MHGTFYIVALATLALVLVFALYVPLIDVLTARLLPLYLQPGGKLDTGKRVTVTHSPSSLAANDAVASREVETHGASCPFSESPVAESPVTESPVAESAGAESPVAENHLAQSHGSRNQQSENSNALGNTETVDLASLTEHDLLEGILNHLF